MTRVLIVQPEADDGPLALGEWLVAAGVQLTVLRPFAGDPVPPSVDDGFDGLVVLGGVMNAFDDATHPWLADIRALLADAVRRGLPTLAICLGAQLLTVATGGRVELDYAGGPEIGLVALDLTDEGRADPLLAALPAAAAPALAWHFDASTELPAGAVRLAGTAGCRNQAYRLGSCAWAVQWHPEITPAVWEGWVDGASASLRSLGRSAAELRPVAADAAGALTATWRPVAEAFAALCAGRAAARAA